MASINSRTRDGRKVWLAQINVKGFQRLSRQFDDKQAAQTWADEQERSLRRLRQSGGASPELSTITIAELVERFLRDPTVKQNRSYPDQAGLLAPWTDRYGSTKVRAFGAVQIIDTRDVLLNGRSNARVNRYVSAMRRCWNWGREVGLIDGAWAPAVMLQEPRGRVRYLADDELDAVLRAAEAHSQAMHCAVILSIATGIRQGELLRLTWRDVDFAKGRLTVLESKNGTARSVYLPPAAAGALATLKRAPVVGASVFLKSNGQPFDEYALRGQWKRVRKAAGLKDFRWHDLRHSCASYLAQHGASLLEIGSVLGHKSPSVTMRYAHLVEGKPVTGHDKLDEKLR
jgi:integrase